MLDLFHSGANFGDRLGEGGKPTWPIGDDGFELRESSISHEPEIYDPVQHGRINISSA